MTFHLKEHTFHIISKGQVHQFLFAKNIDGYLIRFQDSILPTIQSEKEGYYYTILHEITQHQDFPIASANRPLVNILLKSMLAEYLRQGKARIDLSLIQHLLYPLMILMHRSLTTQLEVQNFHQNQYIRFTNLLEEQFKNQHGLTYYAQQIGVTKRQLSIICQEKSGKTAKQLLSERIITEAKRILTYTTLSLKEISDQLGYKNVAYFCRRFKKGTGKTPSEYRE